MYVFYLFNLLLLLLYTRVLPCYGPKHQLIYISSLYNKKHQNINMKLLISRLYKLHDIIVNI